MGDPPFESILCQQGGIMKKFVSILVAVMLLINVMPVSTYVSALSALAEDGLYTSADGWHFTAEEDGTLTVTGFTGKVKAAMEIPNICDGHWVVGVADDALAALNGVKDLMIPASVSSIGAGAFSGLSGVTIAGYNGTASRTAARAAGLTVRELSPYDFYDDILDLSEMPAGLYNITDGKSITVSDPYARMFT